MKITKDVYDFPGTSVFEKKYIRTDTYEFHAMNHNVLIVARNGIEKAIKVVDDREFVYSMKKTLVHARDGAEGLVKFFSDEFWKDAACMVMDYMIDQMRPAKL